MTERLPTAATPTPAGPSLPPAGMDRAQAGLNLLSQLTTSLEVTQKALLSGDVAGLEQGTREQIRLQRALETLWAPGAVPAAETYPLAAELRTAQARVLHLGRVQAALLVRAQRWLRLIAHLLAGPEANYGPLRGAPGTSPGP